MSNGLDIRAAVFDVFGTVVDWRGSIIREGRALQARTGLAADWPALADAWRAGYVPAMQRVMDRLRDDGASGWASIDTLHREILDVILPRFGLQGLDDAQRQDFNQVWHRLAPWPDSVAGLQRLKARMPIATLSNGNVALLLDMARHGGLPWDTIFSAELFRAYKPHPSVYRGAAALLGLAPQQVLMVAAHPADLAAAQQAGLRTAYIPRPAERGEGGWMEPVGELRFDVTEPDFTALAARLGG
ncbi:MAG: haloacid dehalogenase type II [Aquabacterium sp.]